MTDLFTSLICRPPRKHYEMAELGPSRFTLGGQLCIRKDFSLFNQRKMRVECSHYIPLASESNNSVERKLPCVVYLHGNSGCRLDADEYVDAFLIEGITVFSLDFTGCGKSEGEYVTLGQREKLDLEAVLEYLKNDPYVSYIALMGRSMGAATAVCVAGDKNYSDLLAGMVLDSCYTSIENVVHELAHKYVGKIPLIPFDSMVGRAVAMLKDAVMVKAGFDFSKLDILAVSRECTAPALFGHAEGDELVLPSHTREVHRNYGGDDKELFIFEGDHNSVRPDTFRQRCMDFIKACFAEREEADARKKHQLNESRVVNVLGFKIESPPRSQQISPPKSQRKTPPKSPYASPPKSMYRSPPKSALDIPLVSGHEEITCDEKYMSKARQAAALVIVFSTFFVSPLVIKFMNHKTAMF